MEEFQKEFRMTNTFATFIFSSKNSWLHFPYNNSLFENDFLMKQSHVKKNKIPIQKFDAVASQLI